MRRRVWLLLATAAAAGCGKRKPTLQALPPGSVVLALGDSITYGTGAAPEAAYPTQLAELTGWKVVNGGVPGDTSAQILARVPALLAETQPALVILSAGGNDFLRRLPDADTEAHLRRAITLIREARAQVVLVAVPLHAGGWARVLGEEKFKSDAIHANAIGYREFAHGLATTLRLVGLLQ